MMDKVTNYISMEKENEAGQKSDGTWYIKSLKFKDKADLREKIIGCNEVLNEVNFKESLKFKEKKKEAKK